MQTHAIQANQPPDINPQLATESTEISTAEKEINRYLTFSSAGLALSSIGAFFAPFTVLSIPFILTGNIPFWQQTYQSLFKKRQIDAALIDFISVAGSIATGHLFAAALRLGDIKLLPNNKKTKKVMQEMAAKKVKLTVRCQWIS